MKRPEATHYEHFRVDAGRRRDEPMACIWSRFPTGLKVEWSTTLAVWLAMLPGYAREVESREALA